MAKHMLMTGLGVGAAMAAGAAMGMAMSNTRKRELRHAADKAVKAVGSVVENLSDGMSR